MRPFPVSGNSAFAFLDVARVYLGVKRGQLILELSS